MRHLTNRPLTSDGGELVLRNARVWPDPDSRVSPPQTVVIRGGRVCQIVPEGGAPLVAGLARTSCLDVEGRVVTAGFANCHVHLTEPVWHGASRHSTDDLQWALDDMLLRHGFATVLDLGSNPRDTVALRRRIEAGELRGPRILTAAGGIYPWRGMPFYVREMLPWYVRWLMWEPATPLAARLKVAIQAQAGAEITKLFTGTYVRPDRVKPMRPGIGRAAVASAHSRGMRVLAHPSDAAGAAIAIAAGVDALAHLPSEPEGTSELLVQAAQNDLWLIPTLHMFAATVSADDTFMGPIREGLRTFLRAGGHVLFGTDVGYMAERRTLPELEEMAACGMSTAQILRSLTVAPAQFLGWQDAGRVRVGGVADLTVLDTDSDALTPRHLSEIKAVVREGRTIFRH